MIILYLKYFIYQFSILFNPYISSSFKFNINLNIDNPIEKISFFSGINYPIYYLKYNNTNSGDI